MFKKAIVLSFAVVFLLLGLYVDPVAAMNDRSPRANSIQMVSSGVVNTIQGWNEKAIEEKTVTCAECHLRIEAMTTTQLQHHPGSANTVKMRAAPTLWQGTSLNTMIGADNLSNPAKTVQLKVATNTSSCVALNNIFASDDYHRYYNHVAMTNARAVLPLGQAFTNNNAAYGKMLVEKPDLQFVGYSVLKMPNVAADDYVALTTPAPLLAVSGDRQEYTGHNAWANGARTTPST
jgi:hypothetical protein